MASMNLTVKTTLVSSTAQDAVHHDERERLFSPEVDDLITTLYVIVTASAIAGNGMVFATFATKRVKCTPFMTMLLNLTISDFLMAVTIYPYVFMDMKKMTQLPQSTANLLCSIGIGLAPFWACMCVNSFAMMTISFIRYMSFRPSAATVAGFVTRARVCGGMAVIWLIAFLLMLPHYFSYSLDKRLGICYRVWPANFNGTVYSVLITLLVVVLPISILTCNFVVTSKRMYSKTGEATSKFVRKERRRVSALLLALISAYFICWAPGFIYMLLSRLDAVISIFPTGTKGEYLRMRIIRINMLIAVSNTVCDPLLYAFTWKSFREGFLPNRTSTWSRSDLDRIPKISLANLRNRISRFRKSPRYTV